MDLYGRPQPPRVVTPNVVFLNQRPKAQSFSSHFASPSGRQDTDVQKALTNAENTSGITSESKHSNESPADCNGKVTNPRPSNIFATNRPQSGGVRRPVSEMANTTTMKQRPSTAREGFRARPSHYSPLLDHQVSMKRNTCFEAPSPASPETDEHSVEVEHQYMSPRASVSSDELYIQQLKDEIRYFYQISKRKDTNLSRDHATHNHHIKNVHNIRESRLCLPGHDALESVEAQLLRYSYSLDPVQLATSKSKLEAILSERLTELMDLYIRLDEDGNAQCTFDLQHTNQERVELTKLPNSFGATTSAFINGCGTSTVSIYAAIFRSVLQRTEILQAKMLGAAAEKNIILSSVADKDRQLDKLKEQIIFFKDAIARINDEGGRHWTQLQNNWQTTTPMINHHDDFKRKHRSSQHNDLVDHLEQISAIEAERETLKTAVSNLTMEKEDLRQQLDTQAKQLETVSRQLQELIVCSKTQLQDERAKLETQVISLELLLSTKTDQFNLLEQATSQDKQQLQREIEELESLRQKEHKLHLKTQASLKDVQANINTELETAKAQVHTVTIQLKKSQEWCKTLKNDIQVLETDKMTHQESIQRLTHDNEALNCRIRELTEDIAAIQSSADKNEMLLQYSEERLNATSKELEQMKAHIAHQENQLQQLEPKLSRSIPVDEEEVRIRRQQDEQNWHQKLAALEHELASERQEMSLLRDQHQKSIAIEQENAAHAVSQARVLREELETANLCLAERKKQRERDKKEFEEYKAMLSNKITSLTKELDDIKKERHQALMEIECLHQQIKNAQAEYESIRTEATRAKDDYQHTVRVKQLELEALFQQKMEEGIHSHKVAAEEAKKAMTEVQMSLATVKEERDMLLHKLQNFERTTPRSHSALSETRIELQKAKQKIASLEEKLSRSETALSKDIDYKSSQLSSRERHMAEDLKALKKQRIQLDAQSKSLEAERKRLEQDKEAHRMELLAFAEEKRLLQQVISLLNHRLRLQMELLAIVPVEVSSQIDTFQTNSRRSVSSLEEFLRQFRVEHVDLWRKMQNQWEHLNQTIDDADWQLIHMRNRLQELNVEEVVMLSTDTSTSRYLSSISSASPFSDAIAAGKDTVPVAEQLKASTSMRNIPIRSVDAINSQETMELKAKVEEHETFAIALQKEMQAMKESYEGKLDEVQQELRQTQKLRMESCQRIRNELDEERKRSQHTISHLSDKCVALEARLMALQQSLTSLQDQEIALLEQHFEASDELSRRKVLQSLFDLISRSCEEKLAMRKSQRQERLEKLHAYCGSSSVTVERDEKKQLQ